MFCRCFGLWVALAWEARAGGNALQVCFAFGDGLDDYFQVSADRAVPLFVNVFGVWVVLAGDCSPCWIVGFDFWHFSADRAGPCFVDVLASGWRWPRSALQACFWGWFGQLFPGVG
jgi:hypothetical protein